jgi:hypothetical protein
VVCGSERTFATCEGNLGALEHNALPFSCKPAAESAPGFYTISLRRDCQLQRLYGGTAVARDYGVRFAETCVSSRPGPSAVGLPVVFTCTRPNVSTNTQRASKHAILRRNSVSTG